MSYQSSTYDPKKHTLYKPINEAKYMGKEFPVCRSSWESSFCEWCDKNQNILQWSSEAIQIPYYDPIKKKMRRYYPDFTILVNDANNKQTTYVIEIKPYKETIPPKRTPGKKERSFLYEYFTFQTNVAKWKAAEIYCRKYGVSFKLLTEKDLFKR